MAPAVADGDRAHLGFGIVALFYGILIVIALTALLRKTYPDRSKATVVNFATAALRVLSGVGIAVLAGWPKYANPALFEKFMVTVGTLGIPIISRPESTRLYAWLAVGAELGGGAALAAGLFTRWSALALAATHLVALYAHLVVWGDDPIVVMSVGGSYGAGCFVYEIIWWWFVVNGAGPMSLDATIKGLMGRGGGATAATATAPAKGRRRETKKAR